MVADYVGFKVLTGVVMNSYTPEDSNPSYLYIQYESESMFVAL
jgi:hypothetical protein